jgi:hypothetical protein
LTRSVRSPLLLRYKHQHKALQQTHCRHSMCPWVTWRKVRSRRHAPFNETRFVSTYSQTTATVIQSPLSHLLLSPHDSLYLQNVGFQIHLSGQTILFRCSLQCVLYAPPISSCLTDFSNKIFMQSNPRSSPLCHSVHPLLLSPPQLQTHPSTPRSNDPTPFHTNVQYSTHNVLIM